jgi:3-(3-hydroxy-phenyl)propionate hydroxylase
VQARDGSVKRLDDLLEQQFALVATTPEATAWMSEASLSCWEQLGGERVVIADAGRGSKRDDIATFIETDGVFSSWMRDNQVSAVIVRPDRYVFGGAANAQELNMLIGNLSAELCSAMSP